MKEKKNIVGGILILIVLAVGFWLYGTFTSYAPTSYVTENASGTPVTIDTTTKEVHTTVKSFTLTEIAQHSNEMSCYTAISGSVFDLTAWVKAHPGGSDKILFICGKDGTDAFVKKHKSAPKFIAILDRFKIGTLAQ